MKPFAVSRPEIEKRIRAANQILVFLDYDGTLVPIQPTPGLARLSPGQKKILAGLARRPRFKVGLLTGRSLKNIRRAVRVPGLFYAANYGLAIVTPQKSWVHPEARAKAPLLKRMWPQLKLLGSEFRGVRVEEKTLTAAVHYRQYRGKPSRLKNRLEEIIRTNRGAFTLKIGKKIFEVYPAVKWDKGKALLKVERLLGFRRAPLVIFFGDDHADEEAFRRMNSKDISVAVGGNRKTAAQYFCRNSGEVAAFLKRLLHNSPGERR